ncbi:hypothetical protein [uncultured Desulfuromusa sp.]|uniref:hypothetical protein n=1 Tax=uncultured Desulfuromusa sp. TaxID=219183 RepID=UPI002AA8848D|nr:hypothetical protein [uncultured Desulfuromusa sp.]
MKDKLIEKVQSIAYTVAFLVGVFILILTMVLPARAAHLYHEKHYQQIWCDAARGITEYRLPDATRVDCLLDEYAVEFDFASKWAESIGQALYYGYMTDSKPGVVLILEKESDSRYLDRLKLVADKQNITVWTMGPEE